MKTPLSLLLVCLIMLAPLAHAQQPGQNQQQADDVLRIDTELVQTDVMVFDKTGRFVDGLKKEDFEVRADGRPVEVNIFDRVRAGSAVEEEKIKAARGGARTGPQVPAAFRGTTRGRSVIFFLDDYHLSSQSVDKTRKLILQFIEKDMGPHDQVAIASASGQIGFLEQFTDNKAVLRAAVARLGHRPYVIQDNEGVPMTEYQAIRINGGDRDAVTYFANELLKATNFRNPGGQMGPPPGGPAGRVARDDGRGKTSGMTREMAESQVKRRAEYLIKQSVNVTSNTLATLESLMRSSSQYPGRKLVFLVSDGFYLINNVSGAQDWVRRITDAALRAGVVVYSMDARGLTNSVNVTDNRFDPDGKLSRANIGELSSSQDALNALASDTGGRALFNSDAMGDAVTRALRETSEYYLLAWKPPGEEQKGGKFKKVEVSIKGRPELTVRLPRGYLEPDANSGAASTQKTTTASSGKGETLKPVEAAFRDALVATAPRRGLPTLVDTSYLDTPNNGTVLATSMQVAAQALSFGADGRQPSAVDVAGVVLNDQGKPAASFKTRLTVSPLSADPSRPDTSSVIYNYKTPLKPGIYQVRVAAREERTGKVGSSMQWIEIPDLSQKRLTLSSLLIGGQVVGSSDKKAGGATSQQIQFSVDHRFARSSHLGFWVFIYNARLDAKGAPDVTAQVQIFREGQSVVTTPARKLTTAGMQDLARIPYGGDFALSGLPPGRYVLQVTITDRIGNTSASQRANFDVE